VQLRERTEEEAAQVTRKVNRPAARPAARKQRASTRTNTRASTRTKRPSTLATMSKSELLHLAQERAVPGRSAMSKKQLVTALEKKQ
jgi:hypothetical protein